MPSTLAPLRFTSTRLEDGNMVSYGVGLLVLLVPGLVMLLFLAGAFILSTRRRADATLKRAGWKWRTAAGLAGGAAVVGLILAAMASSSGYGAVSSARSVYTDAQALVERMDLAIGLARNHTRDLGPALAPMIAPALALNASTGNPYVDALRATALEIQTRLVLSAELVAAADTARSALADARTTLADERATVDSIYSNGVWGVYGVGGVLIVLFLAGGLLAAWSKPKGVLPFGVVLAVLVLLVMPVSVALDDGCVYYGDLEPRAEETSALALACLRDTNLLTAAGASVDALSPDTFIHFPQMTAVNTSTPLGASLAGLNAAHDATAALFAELQAIRDGATCGPVSASVWRFRNDLCAAPPRLYGASVCALVLLLAAVAALFLWAPAVAYAPVAATPAATVRERSRSRSSARTVASPTESK